MSELLTVREVSRWTGLHPEAVRRRIRSGVLSAVPRGRGVRTGYLVAKHDVLKLCEDQAEREEAGFIESAAPLFPDLPTLQLPPSLGTAKELIEYASTCLRMADIALSRAQNISEAEGEDDD
jgi:hypothetical protein